MDRDEETDEMVQQAKALLESLGRPYTAGGPGSEETQIARSVQAIGILLGALVLETRALRHSQETGNRMISARLELEQERRAQEKRDRPLGL